MDNNTNRVKEEATPFVAATSDDDWVRALIEMTRPGIDFRMPSRLSWERVVPFEFDDFS